MNPEKNTQKPKRNKKLSIEAAEMSAVAAVMLGTAVLAGMHAHDDKEAIDTLRSAETSQVVEAVGAPVAEAVDHSAEITKLTHNREEAIELAALGLAMAVTTAAGAVVMKK